ncbi:hypothetical protein BJX70DRAFT_132811 [Aspergillus crustosus]
MKWPSRYPHSRPGLQRLLPMALLSQFLAMTKMCVQPTEKLPTAASDVPIDHSLFYLLEDGGVAQAPALHIAREFHTKPNPGGPEGHIVSAASKTNSCAVHGFTQGLCYLCSLSPPGLSSVFNAAVAPACDPFCDAGLAFAPAAEIRPHRGPSLLLT